MAEVAVQVQSRHKVIKPCAELGGLYKVLRRSCKMGCFILFSGVK